MATGRNSSKITRSFGTCSQNVSPALSYFRHKNSMNIGVKGRQIISRPEAPTFWVGPDSKLSHIFSVNVTKVEFKSYISAGGL